MDREAILLIGIQAVGKSTFYKQYFADTHLRINLDMLRTRYREALILKACLEAQQSFVVDNTNPTIKVRERYMILAKPAGFKMIGYYFQSKIKDALQRNSTRPGKACIPEQGVRATRGKLQIPSFKEGFDALYYVTITSDHGFNIQEWVE